jgi:hypothetical protein
VKVGNDHHGNSDMLRPVYFLRFWPTCRRLTETDDALHLAMKTGLAAGLVKATIRDRGDNNAFPLSSARTLVCSWQSEDPSFEYHDSSSEHTHTLDRRLYPEMEKHYVTRDC